MVQKPSGIASKETILRVHLIPALGGKRLDAITAEDVQQLKTNLREKAPKTVNNVLTVLNVLLKKAVEWNVIDQPPCVIQLLSIPRREAAFHEFDSYEKLVEAAREIRWQTYLIALLGGEGGLRVGEIIGLEWEDVDFARGQLCVRHSDWRGELTSPKSGRVRFVTMTERLATALQTHRHLRGKRVVCKDDGTPLTRQGAWSRIRYAARRAEVKTGVHVLRHTFGAHLATLGAAPRSMQELMGHQDLKTTQRYMHLGPTATSDTIRLLDQARAALHDGDILETGSTQVDKASA